MRRLRCPTAAAVGLISHGLRLLAAVRHGPPLVSGCGLRLIVGPMVVVVPCVARLYRR